MLIWPFDLISCCSKLMFTGFKLVKKKPKTFDKRNEIYCNSSLLMRNRDVDSVQFSTTNNHHDTWKFYWLYFCFYHRDPCKKSLNPSAAVSRDFLRAARGEETTRDTYRYWRTSSDFPMASLPQEAGRRTPIDADEPQPPHPTGCRLQRKDNMMKYLTVARLQSSNYSAPPAAMEPRWAPGWEEAMGFHIQRSPWSISVPGSISGLSASASSSPAASGMTKTWEGKKVTHLPSHSVSSASEGKKCCPSTFAELCLEILTAGDVYFNNIFTFLYRRD